MTQMAAIQIKHTTDDRAHLKFENIARSGDHVAPDVEYHHTNNPGMTTGDPAVSRFENPGRSKPAHAEALRAGWKALLSSVVVCVAAFSQPPTIATSLGKLAIQDAAIATVWPPFCEDYTTPPDFCETGHFLNLRLAMAAGGVIPGGIPAVMDASEGVYVLSGDGTKWMRFGVSGSEPATTVDLGFHIGASTQTFRLFWAGNAPLDLGPLLAPPTANITSVSNGASFLPGIVSGSWITIMGTNLSTTTRGWTQADFNKGALPLSLDGVRVKINNKDAPVDFISPTQINALAPPDTATGSVAVTVSTSRGTSNTMYTTLERMAPGWFAFSQHGAIYAAAVHADGTAVGPAGLFGTSAVAAPAKPNETILLFGTGFGPTKPPVDPLTLFSGAAPLATPNDLRITVGGQAATVAFAGLVVNGEYQFNVVVPNLPSGEHDVIAAIGGAHTQTLKLMVQDDLAANCTSNCLITTSVGKFMVTNAQIGDRFPPGCAPGPGCSMAETGFEVLVVSLGLQGSLAGSPLDLSNPNAYVLAEDGSKAPVFSGGLLSGPYFVAFTPKNALRKFLLFWPGNVPVDLSQFLP